jgi:hypothetical protein
MDIGSVFIFLVIVIVGGGFAIFMYGIATGLWARRMTVASDEELTGEPHPPRPVHRGGVPEQEEREKAVNFESREQARREEARS